MKVIGKGRVTATREEDEYPHPPVMHPDWQESVVLDAWDMASNCHFFFRIGHEPGFGSGGTTVMFSNIWADGMLYRHCAEMPMIAGDRFANGCGGGPTLRYEYDGAHRWTLRDGEVSADLAMRDFMPAFDFFPTDHNLGDVAPHHVEATGHVSGTVSLQGRTFRIDKAIGHRDRSWGTRKWESVLGHRWAPAIFSERFMVHALGMLAPDGSLRQFGYVYRDGVFHVPRRVSIAALVEADGLSTRGGIVHFDMEEGERIEVRYHNIAPGSLSLHRGYICNDAPARVECDGEVGCGILEVATQLIGGGRAPRQDALIGSYIENGLFSYRSDSSFIGN